MEITVELLKAPKGALFLREHVAEGEHPVYGRFALSQTIPGAQKLIEIGGEKFILHPNALMNGFFEALDTLREEGLDELQTASPDGANVQSSSSQDSCVRTSGNGQDSDDIKPP